MNWSSGLVSSTNSEAAPSAAAVALQDVGKVYDGSVNALQGFTLDVPAGIFLTLLGPSGSGKTTLLRAIAGLVEPTTGDIAIGGKTVFSHSEQINVPVRNRDIGMVFQSFALWPHMTVDEIVGFPLKIRKWSKQDREKRVAELLRMIGLDGYGDRYPDQLSGGQQQRVSLARSIAYSPSLLLLDEPLSNLDAELRVEMRAYLKQFQQDVGTTAIYVTHDREEALALSDVIVVMDHGNKIQTGPPQEVASSPATTRVARFLAGANVIRLQDLSNAIHGSTYHRYPNAQSIAVMPEDIEVAEDPTSSKPRLAVRVITVEYLRSHWRVQFRPLHNDAVSLFAHFPDTSGHPARSLRVADVCDIALTRILWFDDNDRAIQDRS